MAPLDLLSCYPIRPDKRHEHPRVGGTFAESFCPGHRSLTKDILSSIKQPFSKRIVAKLKKENPDLLKKMESGARRGNSLYSFWQVGGGYDRNVHGAQEIWGCIEYIHLNPVRRRLAERTEDWPWSSARFYKEMPTYEFEVDRCEEWIY